MYPTPLIFRPRRTEIDLSAILESKADLLARSIVRMAAEGADGGLRETLLAIDPEDARRALEETACLYLYVARRTAGVFLAEDVVPEYLHDSFDARTFEQVAALIAANCGDTGLALENFMERFGNLWYERREIYGSCTRMYRQPNEGLRGTVIYEFYRCTLDLGRETSLHVLAGLQVPLLHVELSRIFGELICEALGMET